MKNKFIIPVALILLLTSCNNREFLKRMQENEEGVHRPTTVAELQNAISKYERRVDDIMLVQNRIAIWYKMLGTRYVDAKMYIKALEAFTSALEYYPDNHNLYYEIGFCASEIAKGFANVAAEAGHDAAYYYELAVNSYVQALALQPNYTKSAYALAVLYVYELGESDKAISVLLPVVEREPKNYDALFVLGAAYYLEQKYDDAIRTYKVIVENAKDENVVASAKKNILQIESGQK